MAPPDSAPVDPVSAFFRREERALVGAAASGASGARNRILDLACGRGRHALAAAELGLDVLAVDRNATLLAELADRARSVLAHREGMGRLEVLAADLETDAMPSLPGGPFAALLVFRYLHRPLAPAIEAWLAPGGLLLYETFTTEQRSLGWGPTRDAFLLQPGELPTLFPGLVVESFEEGRTSEASPAFTARLRARKPLALR